MATYLIADYTLANSGFTIQVKNRESHTVAESINLASSVAVIQLDPNDSDKFVFGSTPLVDPEFVEDGLPGNLHLALDETGVVDCFGNPIDLNNESVELRKTGDDIAVYQESV